MKARIVNNLLDVIEAEMGECEGHRDDAEFLILCAKTEPNTAVNKTARKRRR